jgi:predicted Zn-dependent peptidase
MTIDLPSIQSIRIRPFPEFGQRDCSGGARLFIKDAPDWEVFKIEGVFPAGRPYESKPGLSKALAGMLKVGTAEKGDAEISEFVESRGGQLSVQLSADFISIALSGPSMRFFELMPMFFHLIESAVYTPKSWKQFQNRQKHRLQADATIHEVVAYKHLTERLFGREHPYGYNASLKTYSALSIDDIVKYREKVMQVQQGAYLLSGGLSEGMVDRFVEEIEKAPSATPPEAIVPAIPLTAPGMEYISPMGRQQVSIRMGRYISPDSLEESAQLQLLQTLLGGFFGSRLMRKIRDQGGMSYHAFSHLESMRFADYWMIGTEVATANTARAIDLIRDCLQELVDQPISPPERQMVQNYMTGLSLEFFDGAFQQIELIKNDRVERSQAGTYEAVMSAVKAFDVERIQLLAQKYYAPENAYIVVAG